MQNRQIIINASMSVTQVVVISVALFILYRFLLNTIGIERLGIWSLVLATTSVTQIANFGLSGSVIKFVAKYVARREDETVSSVIQTAALSVAAFGSFFLLIGYPISKLVLGLVVENEYLPLALSILPYAFLAFWIMLITSIFQAGLDGYQRIDLRSLLLLSSALLNLLLCFVFAPIYGLIGVAYARVLVNVLILISSWLVLKRCLPTLPNLPYRLNKSMLRKIIGYGLNFQIMTVSAMFYDPITKALLSKFGGLSMVGYYEMANKMVQQFRTLIVSANQVIVPAIADLMEKNPDKIQAVYLNSYQLLFYLALPLYSLIIICVPIISVLWIGHYESVFVISATLLAVGWFLNTLNAPAYFAYLGIGELRWNMISHITIGLLNAGLGFMMGVLFNGIGVVVAFVFSLVLGSGIIFLSYHIKYKIPLFELLPRSNRVIALVCIAGILSFFIINLKFSDNFSIRVLNTLIPLSFSIIVLLPFWLHPMRKKLTRMVTNTLLNKEPGSQ